MKNLFLLLFLCLGASLTQAQSITNVTPSQNPVDEGGNLSVAISGNNTNFQQGSSTYVYAYVNGSYVPGYVNNIFNNSIMNASFYLPCGVCGIATVYVQNPIDGTLAYNNAFSVNCSQLTGISPSTINAGQTLPISISGTNMNFSQGSNSVYFYSSSTGQTLYPSSYNSATSSTLNVSLSVPSNSCSTTYDVCATSNTGCTECISNALTVVGTNPNPVINSVSPNTGTPGQTLTISISGTDIDFTQGSSLYFQLYNPNFGASTYGYNNSPNPFNSAQTTIDFNLPSYCGTYDLHIYGADCSGSPVVYTSAITINSGLNPVINSVSPNTGTSGQNLTVSISGTDIDFTQGSSMYFELYNSSSGVYTYGYNNSPNPFNSAQTTVDFNLPNTCGTYDLRIYGVDPCGSSVVYTSAITVNSTLNPVINAVSPNTATAGQPLTISISGTDIDFTQGSSMYFELYNNSSGTNTYGYNNSPNPFNSAQTTVDFMVPSTCGTYDLRIYGADCNGSPVVYTSAITVTSTLNPVINTVSPNTGTPGQILTVNMTTSDIDFTQNSPSLYIELKDPSNGNTIPGYNLVPNTFNSTQASITFNPSTYDCGTYDLIIYNVSGGCNSTSGITYTSAVTISSSANPQIISNTPDTANLGDNINLTINVSDLDMNQVNSSSVYLYNLKTSEKSFNSFK
ncbi:MAG: hypothetical protein GY810_12420 [Aureispira sp.]|nr:hypothetical protein [Aureispira sp.]